MADPLISRPISRGTEEEMSLAAGSKLGPYEVLGPLGAGGMGEVLRFSHALNSR